MTTSVYTVHKITRAGVAVTFTENTPASGDQFVTDDKTCMLVQTGATPTTITFAGIAACDLGTVHTNVVTGWGNHPHAYRSL